MLESQQPPLRQYQKVLVLLETAIHRFHAKDLQKWNLLSTVEYIGPGGVEKEA